MTIFFFRKFIIGRSRTTKELLIIAICFVPPFEPIIAVFTFNFYRFVASMREDSKLAFISDQPDL